MPQTIRQNVSFARGEISPVLYARVDLVDYALGAATVRNFLVGRQGGAISRPGTRFVCEVKNSSAATQLFPFIFNASQTYVLEFGNLYMRVVKEGAQVTDTNSTITDITQASPGRVTTSAAHGLSDGQEVVITGVVGMTEVNGRNFKVDVQSATTFDLYEMDGTTAFNTSSFTAYSAAGTARRVFELVTPYVTADLSALDAYSQDADVITIVHPNYAPRELARSSDTSWTLTTITFGPSISPPNGGSATIVTGGTFDHRWRLTALDEDTLEESLPGREATTTITNTTQANPVVVTTSAANVYEDGDEVYIEGIVGMTELNGRTFIINQLTTTTFELNNENGTGYNAYVSGGTAARTYIKIAAAALVSTTNPATITFPLVSGAGKYNVYRALDWGDFAYVGTAEGSPFVDVINLPSDPLDSHPISRDLFTGSGNFPAAATYYQQRLVLGGSDNTPNTAYASQTANFKNFNIRQPIQADDSITIPIVGRQVNRIKRLLDIGTLVMFTSGGEITVLGDQAGVLTPFDINTREASYNGIGDLRPLVINRTAIYLQERGDKIRDLLYDFESNGYSGVDLSIKSAHLIEGFSLNDWDYQQNPHSIIWACRSDGVLLGITYVREQEIVAWHHHDTDGEFENAVCVPEDHDNAVYFIVKREIAHPDTGVIQTKRYIERMTERDWTDIKDAVCVDSSLTYDGRNTDEDNTVTINSAGTVAVFGTSADGILTGNELHVRGADGALLKVTIGSPAVPPLTFTISTTDTVPDSIADTPVSDWTQAVDEITGLWHLEGKDVSVQGDGYALANPNNEDFTVKAVTDGTVDLGDFFGVVHVGLPYLCDLKTLSIDNPGGRPLVDTSKLVNRVFVHVERTRGLWIGPEAPEDDDDDPRQGLIEHKPRTTESYDEPPTLQTGIIDLHIEGHWKQDGSVFIRVLDPVPANILAVLPSGIIAGR